MLFSLTRHLVAAIPLAGALSGLCCQCVEIAQHSTASRAFKAALVKLTPRDARSEREKCLFHMSSELLCADVRRAARFCEYTAQLIRLDAVSYGGEEL